MASLDRPKLRPLSGRRVDHRGRPFLALEDSLGLVSGPCLIPLEAFHQVVRHFDGRMSLGEIRARVLEESGLMILPEELGSFIEQPDRAMVLDGPTFATFQASYANSCLRPASFAGRSYPADASSLRAELARFFVHPLGAGIPNLAEPAASGSLRAIISPHIDFGRGGPVYTHAYKALVEDSDADIFVILGVAHQHCRQRFALTRKDFETPLGIARTDAAFVDHLGEAAGLHLFEDELVHRTEHSIEFQVVFLQYLLGGRRDFTIVPILVGSFHDLMLERTEPIDDPEVRRMVEALRSAERDSGKKVVYIGGIDLCHAGPEFGDPTPVDDATLGTIKAFDEAMLGRATAADASGWFSTAAEIDNRWRVCGLAATYTMLHAIGPARGSLLGYGQAVNPSRSCCVTFASVAYDAGATVDDA